MRICARESCDEPVTSTHASARYCSNACKCAHWRAEHGYALQGTRKACQTRKKRGGPSGMQVSYAKVRRELLDRLRQYPGGERLVDEALKAALSDRQRARLNART